MRKLPGIVLAIMMAGNLVWPTSAPLQANGLPLNRSIEYVVFTIFLAWLAFVTLRAILGRITPFPKRPAPFGQASRILTLLAIALGVLLLLVRSQAPIEDSIQARYSTPERPNVESLFLADDWYMTSGSRAPSISRYEEQLQFDPRRSQTWRLSAFNSREFNIRESDPGTIRERRQEFRRRDAHPFEVSFAWNSRVADRLASLYPAGADLLIRYRGDARISTAKGGQSLPFSDHVKLERIPLSAPDFQTLRLDYANFSCPDTECRDNLTMNSLPIVDSVYQVWLTPIGSSASEARPLTTALFAAAGPLLSLSSLGPIIEMLFLLAIVARGTMWMCGLLVASWPGRRNAAVALVLAAVLWTLSIGMNGHISQQLRHLPFVFMVLPAAFSIVSILRRRDSRDDRSSQSAVIQGMLLVVTLGLLAVLPSLSAMMSTASQLQTADTEAIAWKTERVMPAVMLGDTPLGIGASTPDGAAPFGLGWNESWISPVGDDPLTYSSWARDFLASPKPLVDPTMIASKPFFIYYRAALYAVFGDGDTYSAIFGRQVTWWSAAALGLFLLAVTTRMRIRDPQSQLRIGSRHLALLCLGGMIWLGHSIVTYAIPTTAWQFSEGPAWQLLFFSMALLLGTLATSDLLLCLMAGVAFAVGVLMRTTNLPLMGMELVVIWMGFSPRGRLMRAAMAFAAPTIVAMLAIWLQAGAPLEVPREVAKYYASNTGIPSDRGLAGLVPDLAALGVAEAALVAAAVSVMITCGRLARTQVIGVVIALLAGGFLPAIPQLAAPYYPRSVISIYYVLSVIPAMLLIFSWRQDLAFATQLQESQQALGRSESREVVSLRT